MPIPKKPGELREMMCNYLDASLAPYTGGDTQAVRATTDAAMRVLAEYDPCFAKAAEAGMPSFTLIAKDRVAASVVGDWIRRSVAESLHMDKIGAAIECMNAMRAWPNRKLPD